MLGFRQFHRGNHVPVTQGTVPISSPKLGPAGLRSLPAVLNVLLCVSGRRGIAVLHSLQMCRYLNLLSHQAELPPEPREVHRRLRKTILRDESWVSAVQFMPFAPGKHLLVSSLALTGKQKTISCCSLSASSASSKEFPPGFPIRCHIWEGWKLTGLPKHLRLTISMLFPL